MWYDPDNKHGLWVIEDTPDGLKIRCVDADSEGVATPQDSEASELTLPLFHESHS